MLAISRSRILCVDDDEDSRVVLTTLLNLALIEAKGVGTAARRCRRIKQNGSTATYSTHGCRISMAFNCVAGRASSTRTHRCVSFPARPLKLTRRED
jgi:hypothetical protein